MGKMRNLPDGETTTNTNDYLNAWEKKGKTICDSLKLRISAFDPSFSFIDVDEINKVVANVSLPLWFVERVNEALEIEWKKGYDCRERIQDNLDRMTKEAKR